MADIYADSVTKLGGGAYKWAGFVEFTTVGGGQVDTLILENGLTDQRLDLDYVRVQQPAEWDGEQMAAVVTTLTALSIRDSSGATDVFYTADDATAGDNAVHLLVTDSAGGGPHTRVIFVEYGLEHSVDK